MSTKMQVMSLSLRPDQVEWLKKRSFKTETNISEIIRRLLDREMSYVEDNERREELQRARDEAAKS